MANYQAIHATCEAVMKLLEKTWKVRQPQLFDGADLDFRVCQETDFATLPIPSVSLFLYYVNINPIYRTMPGRFNADGSKQYPQLPLDLYFILTPWAENSSIALQILGWTMRVLEDNPTLTPTLLNETHDPQFAEDETVDIVAGQMTYEEIFRIWEVLPGDFRLSVPYIARVVRIESEREEGSGVVLERHLDFGKVKRS
jgi:Pvc16 N-terminal domain